MSVDTLSLARELRASELPAAQAEAVGRAVVEGAATKSDISELRVELHALKGEIKSDVESMRSSLLVWFIGTQVAVGALIVALVKL